MGMIEEAKVSLAQGVRATDDRELLIASVQAALAAAEALQSIESMMSDVVERLDKIDSAVMMVADNTDD